jgi:hypothetical protein
VASKETSKNAKDKHKERFLSFVGGALAFSVVLGVIVSKDERIRQELQKQAKRFLEASKKVLAQYEGFVGTINNIRGQSNNAKDPSGLTNGRKALPGDEYEQQWVAVEKMAVR